MDYKLKNTVGNVTGQKLTSIREENPVDGTRGGRFDGKVLADANGGIHFFTCALDSESAIYNTITDYIGAAAEAHPYKTQKFEAARLRTGGQITPKTIGNYLNPGFKAPKFTTGSYAVTRILVVYNPTSWTDFTNFRTEYRANLIQAGLGNANPIMQRISWAKPPSDPYGIGFSFPVLDANIGECFLFHGTGGATIPKIAEGGFGPEYCKYRPKLFSGYGSLGQGSYLSDNLAKSATYCDCPSCGRNGPCACVDAKGNPVERVAVISRAIVPPDTETHRGRRTGKLFSHQHVNLKGDDQRQNPIRSQWPPAPVTTDEIKGSPLVIGLNTDDKFIRKWPSNVFLFRDKKMLYPEFLVYFTWPLQA